MPSFNLNLTISTNARNFDEVNNELSRMKCVIGILLAKLPEEHRDQIITELNELGLTEESKLYSSFNPKL